MLHLPAILETGLTTFHFGAPMDLPAALGKVGPDVVLCGNLDPAGVFCQLAPAEVTARAADLLAQHRRPSQLRALLRLRRAGGAPLASLDAFYAAVKGEPVSQFLPLRQETGTIRDSGTPPRQTPPPGRA